LWSKIGLKSRKVKLFRIIFYTAYKMRGASGREMMRYDAMQLHAGSPFFWKQRGIAHSNTSYVVRHCDVTMVEYVSYLLRVHAYARVKLAVQRNPRHGRGNQQALRHTLQT
jgi:hypothetical protein